MYRFDCNRKVPELTDEEWQRYNSTKKCENCGKEFGTRRDDGSEVCKVKHHDYVTNKFIGAWCSKCNIRNNNRYFKTIVVFHNFSGYDSHFIINYVTKFMHNNKPYSTIHKRSYPRAVKRSNTSSMVTIY
jgi:hypothetical protein